MTTVKPMRGSMKWPGESRCETLKNIEKQLSSLAPSELNISYDEKASAVHAIRTAVKILCPGKD